MARIMCCRENHNSLLIGARNRVTTNNLERISASLSLCQTEVSKRCFLRNLGYEGTVLASKDSIIVSLHGTETVVLIDRFLSVRCKEQCCRLVGERTVKPFQLNDNGETSINILNGFPEVKLQPNGEKVFFLTEDIQRKVALYVCGEELATVVDYMRKLRTPPYEPIVPVYPEEHDMLLSQETSGMGKCLVSTGPNKLWMCISLYRNPGNLTSFVQETFGRAARNSIAFDSILAVASGTWTGSNCWEETV